MPRMRPGEAVGVEQVEVGQLLAGAGEGDGLAHDLPSPTGRRRRGVAVELGEDHRAEARVWWKASAVVTGVPQPIMASMTRNV